MLKVLLVDDEMFVRKGMHELIDWHGLGMEIAGEAENGLEALDRAECLQPDVIITDIRMPVLDGLELIRSVVKSPNLEPVFIIISGYHDFKYAQQAIRYGVQDYILKPIDEEEMTATLQKAGNLIRTKRKHVFLPEEQASSLMLENMIKGQVHKAEEHRYAEMLGIGHQASLMIALIEPQQGLEVRTSDSSTTSRMSSSIGGGWFQYLRHGGAARQIWSDAVMEGTNFETSCGRQTACHPQGTERTFTCRFGFLCRHTCT